MKEIRGLSSTSLFIFSLFVFMLSQRVVLAQEETASVKLTVVGQPEIVFDWQRDACGWEDIPDMPAHAFRDAQGRVQLIDTIDTNRRFIGPDLNHLHHDCQIIMKSKLNPDPSKYAYRQWLNSTYTLDGKTIYALVHDEFHGNEIPILLGKVDYRPYWYAAITAAISDNGGESYHPVGNGYLVATIPYRYDAGMGPVGINDPTNIIHNTKDGYYYVIANSIKAYRTHPTGSVLMRTKDLADPHSWRAWDGHGFNVWFYNPYNRPQEPPERHVFQSIQNGDFGVPAPHYITWNTMLNKFILFGAGWFHDPQSKRPVWGCIVYSLSDDLIHWSKRQLLIQGQNPSEFKPGDPDPLAYVSALDPDSPSRNFETTGKRFYLYYTYENFNRPHTPTNHWQRDRDLVRVPVELSKGES